MRKSIFMGALLAMLGAKGAITAGRAERVPVRNPSYGGSAYHKIDYSHTATAAPNRVSQKKRRLRARRAGKRVGQ